MVVLKEILIVGVVLAAHVLFLGCCVNFSSGEPFVYASVSADLFAVAEIIDQSPQWDRVVAPQVRLEKVPIPVDSPRFVQFDEVQSVRSVGPTSFPRLSAFQSVDASEFARRIAVTSGRHLVVVLSVQVAADGLMTAVDIVRSCGVIEADAAAVDYAHLLRWIPGTVDRVPRSMRVIIPVTFDVSEAPLSLMKESALNECCNADELS